jgi:glycerol-3-phosphate O-acyltransferase
MAELSTPLFEPQPTDRWVAELIRRGQRRLEALDEPARVALLEQALYEERQRLARGQPEPGEREALERLAHVLLRGGQREQVDAALTLIAGWGREIPGRFNPRVYRFATRVLPKLVGGLLSERPRTLYGLRHWDLDIARRLRIEGDVALLQRLASEATLILAPTHVSNLDSPLLGLALYQAGLPPFVYGAGLNLFENPVIGWWMHRLGAYTVDRKKRADLYKDTLKDYSTQCLRSGMHSLFFPGGTRCRSGQLETRLKKGLLGTGLDAWQENLAEGAPRPDIYVIPCTLSYQIVLEAETLIDDHLAEVGRQRYIIDDYEFSRPKEVASFVRRVLELDAAVVCRFGAPLDLVGNPIPRDPAERADATARRRRYVTSADGEVEADPQRDYRYTEALSQSLVAAYAKDTQVLSTHLVARVAWAMLSERRGTTDPFRLVQVEAAGRHLDRTAFIERLGRAMLRVREGAQRGLWHHDLPATAPAALSLALDRFRRFHRSRALSDHGEDIVIDSPRLCLYYQNRLATVPLEV